MLTPKVTQIRSLSPYRSVAVAAQPSAARALRPTELAALERPRARTDAAEGVPAAA
jgi:hypothetical protein